MKIGRATREDIDAACKLIRHLSSLEDGYQPFAEEPEEYVAFDWDDKQGVRNALELLLAAYRARPSGLERIIWGFGAMIDAELFDESVRHLATHPDLGERLRAEKTGQQAANPDRNALQVLDAGIQTWLDERMSGYTDAQYGKGQLRALLAACKASLVEPASAPLTDVVAPADLKAVPAVSGEPEASIQEVTAPSTCWKCKGPTVMVPGGENCPGERGEDSWCPECEVRFPEDEDAHKC